MVGLGNVDNTSDANKPISTATQTALDLKANQATTYTKTETDTLLTAKADQSTTYTKTETDSLVSAKADAATTYNKTEADNLLSAKADQSALSSYEPAFAAVAPLQKVVNVLSGGFDLRLNPSGTVDVYEVAVDSLRASIANQITINDNVTIAGDLTVNGTSNVGGGGGNPYWIAAQISFSGNVNNQKGQQNISQVVKASNDMKYDITFPPHPDGASAVILLGSTEYYCLYRNQTATTVQVYMRNADGTGTSPNGSGEFNIAILA